MRTVRRHSEGPPNWITIFIVLSSIVLVFLFAFPVTAQKDILKEVLPSPTKSAAATPETSPSPTITPIPITSIIGASESALSTLRKTDSFISQQAVGDDIVSSLPGAAQEIHHLERETKGLGQAPTSLDELDRVERDWLDISFRLTSLKKSIQSHVSAIEDKITELRGMRELWQRTSDALNGLNKNEEETQLPAEIVPEEVSRRTMEVLSLAAQVQNQAEEKRSKLLTVESRISELQSAVNKSVDDIRSQRGEELTKAFVRDSPPFWSADWYAQGSHDLANEAEQAISSQLDDLVEYLQARTTRFGLHAILILLITLGLVWARPRIVPIVKSDPNLEQEASFFRMPFASALVLSFLLVGILYPRSPRVLYALLGITAIVPGVFILRRIVDRPINILLYFVLGLYFVDRIRDIFSSLSLTPRIMFSAEILAAIVFLTWFVRSDRVLNMVKAGSVSTFGLVRKVILVAISLFAISLAANAAGFVFLSNLIGNSLLRSAYIALYLYTAARLILSVIDFLIRTEPFTNFRFVLHNPALVVRAIRRTVSWIAGLFWLFAVLNLLSLRDVFLSGATSFVKAGITWGSVEITIGDILIFVIAIWLTILVSRFTRFVLEEDVYPRMDLGPGVSYSISTIIHYVLLTVGFLVGMAVLGVRLSEFTVLVGAVGLGLGFGLQNIINNFVSGLILLFERPVKVGDMVQVDQHQGRLNSIGLRASVVRKVDGSDVILPNSKLISEEVINWTFSDDQRRLEIPFGVAYGTDPMHVMKVINGVAASNPDVLLKPNPRTLFIGFGDNALNFELRAWTADSDNWIPLRSKLVTDMYEALVSEGIEIPFPQRDLYIKNFPPSLPPDKKTPDKKTQDKKTKEK